MRKWLLIAAPLLMAGCDWDVNGIDSCDAERDLEEFVDVGGADLVRIVAEAGDLRVVGRAGIDEVRVLGFACASRRSDLDDIDLVVQRVNDQIRVLGLVPRGGGVSARLDLVVEVPDWMLVDIEDQSGNIDVRGVSGLLIIDESGDIEVFDIFGDVEIEDQSGDLDVFGVAGDVWIWDESGDIRVEDIDGDLNVEEDSSGRITYRNIGGVVRLP